MCTCVDEWTGWLRSAGSSDKTITTRVGTVRRVGALAGVEPCAVTTMDMIRLLDRPLAAWSRVTYVASMRAWGEWLVRTKRREDDPSDLLPKVRHPRGAPRPINEQNLGRVLELADKRTRAMLLLGAYAGLRIHEIAKVRGEDVDEDLIFVMGKGGVTAMLPTHEKVWTVAQAMPREGWWFPSRMRSGPGHVCATSVGNAIRAAMREADVAATPHQLRHRYGTAVLRSSGGNLRVAQELLRHANPATTAIYTKVEDAEKREAIRRIA